MVVTNEVVDDTCKADRPRELGLILDFSSY